MLLAAGFGRRLVPLTLQRAKPTLPFLNRPLLLRQLDYLHHWGVETVMVNLHHRPGSILAQLRQAAAQCLGDGPSPDSAGQRTDSPPAGPRPGECLRISGMQIQISPEEEPLGTSGGLKRAAESWPGEGTLICINADMLTEIDLGAAQAAHARSGRLATLVLVPFTDGAPFTPVYHDGKQILSFGGQDGPGERGIFSGLHFLEPELLERLPQGRSEFLPDLYWPLIRAGQAPGVLVTDTRWMEVGSAGRYLESQIRSLSTAPWCGHSLWPQQGAALPEIRQACAADIHPPVLWGERCFLGWGTILAPGTILGHGVHVGEGARLENCVVGDAARIGPGTTLNRVVVGPGTTVPGGQEITAALLQGGLEDLEETTLHPARPWQGIWRADF